MAHGNVKCDCGHTVKEHYGRGWCFGKHLIGKRTVTCGCTWYWPNVKYQKKQKEKLKKKKHGRISPSADNRLKG